MKLYAVTVYRDGQDPLESRIHMHYKSKLLAEFAACQRMLPGNLTCITAVDVGDPGAALLSLANNPNWLQELPRKVVK